jgi:hypothetical protein
MRAFCAGADSPLITAFRAASVSRTCHDYGAERRRLPTTGEAIVRHFSRHVTQTSSAFAVTPAGRYGMLTRVTASVVSRSDDVRECRLHGDLLRVHNDS